MALYKDRTEPLCNQRSQWTTDAYSTYKTQRGKKTPIRDVMLDLSQDWRVSIGWLLSLPMVLLRFMNFTKMKSDGFTPWHNRFLSSNTIYPYLHGVWKSCRQILA